jgi:hypothetical protein
LVARSAIVSVTHAAKFAVQKGDSLVATSSGWGFWPAPNSPSGANIPVSPGEVQILGFKDSPERLFPISNSKRPAPAIGLQI